MNQKRTLLTVVMALLFAIDITAQSTMDVAKFTRMDQDLTARVTKPVTDNDEGKLCRCPWYRKDGAAQRRDMDLRTVWSPQHLICP